MRGWCAAALLCPRGAAATKYRAAAVEFSMLGDLLQPANLHKELTLALYARYLARAARLGVQIIVFPEEVLFSTRYSNKLDGRAWLRSFAEVVPASLGSVPCDGPGNASNVMKTVSCLGRDNNITIVVNMLSAVPCVVTEPVEQSVCQDGHFFI